MQHPENAHEKKTACGECVWAIRYPIQAEWECRKHPNGSFNSITGEPRYAKCFGVNGGECPDFKKVKEKVEWVVPALIVAVGVFLIYVAYITTKLSPVGGF